MAQGNVLEVVADSSDVNPNKKQQKVDISSWQEKMQGVKLTRSSNLQLDVAVAKWSSQPLE
jgi:hypothetical protein